MLKYIDLFCGICSFHYAFDSVGYECVFACDSYEPARKTYELNFGLRPHYNIYDVDTAKIPKYDILCARFPCQSFSLLGKREGLESSSGALFFQVIRFVQANRPRFVLLENVRGLLNRDGGKTFNTIINSLKAEGYKVSFRLLKQNQLLRDAFDRYVLIHPTIRSRDPISALHSNDKQQNTAADSYGPLPSLPIIFSLR